MFTAVVAEVPPVVSLIVGDAVHNLRSSLDHLACQLVQVGTSKASCSNDTSFPIANGSMSYEETIQRRVKGARQDAKEAIRVIQAYKHGNGHQLWVLSNLDNIDKHRLMLTLASQYASINLRAYLSPRLQNVMLFEAGQWRDMTGIPVLPWLDRSFEVKERLCPLRAGDKLFTGIPNAEMNDNVKPGIEVALVEPDVAEPESVLKLLTQLSQLVKSVVNEFVPFL